MTRQSLGGFAGLQRPSRQRFGSRSWLSRLILTRRLRDTNRWIRGRSRPVSLIRRYGLPSIPCRRGGDRLRGTFRLPFVPRSGGRRTWLRTRTRICGFSGFPNRVKLCLCRNPVIRIGRSVAEGFGDFAPVFPTFGLRRVVFLRPR